MLHLGSRGVALVGAAVLAAVLATAWFLTHAASSGPTYRLATVTLGTVTQTIPLSGNLAAIRQSDIDFPEAGRVAAVKVTVGQRVSAGDVLASLDLSSFNGALNTARANLLSAQARLSLDQQGPTAQSLAQAQAAISTATAQLQNARTSLDDTALVNRQALAQAESAVETDQATVDSDQSVLDADRSKQQSDSDRMNSDCGTPGSASACSADRQAVQADNQRVATDQQTLTRDQGAMTAAQNALTTTQFKNAQAYNQAAGQVNSAAVGLQNARAALVALQAGTTSQQLAIDQSAVTIAQVNVDLAQHNVSQASLVAPADGIVTALNLVVGQSVSGATSSSGAAAAAPTHAVSLLTPGAYQVTGSVSDAQVSQLAPGQQARVTPAGSTEAVSGRVTAVAPAATVASGVATFAVTVTLDGGDLSVHFGTSAAVDIIVNQVVHVLTVPSSAVRPTATGSAVQVLENGQPVLRPITAGAADALRTQVVAGLNDGDQVVVATVTRNVPSTQNRGGLLNPGGARGGRGGGGGGG